MASCFIQTLHLISTYVVDVILLGLLSAILYGIEPSLISRLTDEKIAEATEASLCEISEATLSPNTCPSESVTLLPFVLLFAVSYAAGELVKLVRAPSILGMMAAGVLLRNLSTGHPAMLFHPLICSILRNIALATILLEGGLSLDLAAVAKTSMTAISLCFVPLIADVIIMSTLSYCLLSLPIIWSLMIGFLLSAACAGIIVPFMIQLQRRQLGTEKGIPVIVMTAASMDDVTAIAGFGIMMAFAFTNADNSNTSGDLMMINSESWTYARGPVEIACGIGIGSLYGSMIGLLPMTSCTSLRRLALLTLGAYAGVFFFDRLDMRGAGPLSALTLAMFASSRMRKDGVDVEKISSYIHMIWDMTCPLFFSLIGTEIDFTGNHLMTITRQQLLTCFGIVIIGMICRAIVTFASLSGSRLNAREKAYISIVWLAKAAVQASVAPIALDVARQKGNAAEIHYATVLVLVAFTAVVLSAPVAALAMTLLDDWCLRRRPREDDDVYGDVVLPAPVADQ